MPRYTHTDREQFGQAAPCPTQEICIPWAGSRLPTPMNSDSVWRMVCVSGPLFCTCNSPLANVAAGAGKNGTSSFSASAFAWAVPGTGLALWAPQALGLGVPPFWTQNRQEVPKCSKLLSRLPKRSAEVVEGVFEKLEHDIFSQTCLFTVLDLSSCRNDKNKDAISQKS